MTTEPTKGRGLALTVLLGAIVAYDMLSATVYVGAIGQGVGPAWLLGASIAAGLARAAGAAAALAYRRWGFYLMCAGGLARAVLGIAFTGGFDAVYFAVMTVFVLAVVFGLLVKGGDSSTWARMR